MSRKSALHETTVPFDGDALQTLTRIVRGIPDDEDYVLYEREEEWSLAVGAHTRIVLYADRTVMTHEDREFAVTNDRDPSNTLHTILSSVPVQGWRAYGTASFELSRLIYGLPVSPTEPLLALFVPRQEIRVKNGSMLLRGMDADLLEGIRAAAAEAGKHGPEELPEPLDLDEVIATHAAEEYKESVSAALKEIWAQRYRKVILSRRVPLSQPLDMVASYLSGRKENAPARSYLTRVDGLELAGFSPETVVEVSDDGGVWTTPLAGTRSTGDDLMQELVLREELLADSKEIAEHAISVYLAANELTMACDPTSVRVVNFMLVSRRGAVQHLASRLRGDLLDSCNSWHAFSALFPAVTASGVPKRESIEAIGRLEPQERGRYSGCVLWCDESGEMDAALILRSFYQRDGKPWMQAGAGIMNMSKPERELEETREKLSSFSAYLVGA